MSEFQPAYDLMIVNEGGYQNHPNDPGNYNSNNVLVGTNWGISALTYERYFNQVPTEQDMRNLSKSQAAQIYRSDFWNPYNIKGIREQFIANQIFDIRVHHSNWMWIINRAFNQVGAITSLTTGWSNTNTINKINNLPDPYAFNNALVDQRLAYFDYLIQRDPALAAFRNGWMARADRYRAGRGNGSNWFSLLAMAAGAFFLIPIAIRDDKKKKRKRR